MIRWHRAALLAALVVTACAPGPGDPGYCLDLKARFADLTTAASRACDVDTDCTLVGGISSGSCECAASVGPCGGAAISRRAAADPAFAQQQQAFDRSCLGRDTGLEMICDCRPADLACVDHVCQSGENSCFVRGDAGVAPMPDAAEDAAGPP